MSISATLFENTSIKVGPARKTSHKSKMARRNKKTRSKEGQDRWEHESRRSFSKSDVFPEIFVDVLVSNKTNVKICSDQRHK